MYSGSIRFDIGLALGFEWVIIRSLFGHILRGRKIRTIAKTGEPGLKKALKLALNHLAKGVDTCYNRNGGPVKHFLGGAMSYESGRALVCGCVIFRENPVYYRVIQIWRVLSRYKFYC